MGQYAKCFGPVFSGKIRRGHFILIRQQKRKARNDAKDEISQIAISVAGKVVGRSLTVADQSRLVDEFIDELGDEL